MQVLRSGGCALTKAEALLMLYRACCLYFDQCQGRVPDWVQILANANPACLEAAAEEARADDAIEDVGEI
jgi:hypothetical protein